MAGSEHGPLRGNRQQHSASLQESQVQKGMGFWLWSSLFDREERDRYRRQQEYRSPSHLLAPSSTGRCDPLPPMLQGTQWQLWEGSLSSRRIAEDVPDH